MAFSKTFFLLGLAFAVVLLISSEISARELAEATQPQKSPETHVEESNNGKNCGKGYGCGQGHGGNEHQSGHYDDDHDHDDDDDDDDDHGDDDDHDDGED